MSSSSTLSTTTITSTLSGTPRMGLGYSSGFVNPVTVPPTPATRTVSSPCLLPNYPRVTATGGAAPLPAVLASAASSHAIRNSGERHEVPHSVAGYHGPTIPEL